VGALTSPLVGAWPASGPGPRLRRPVGMDRSLMR
jgi:hypothetical protein